jgi:hypothetical protein
MLALAILAYQAPDARAGVFTCRAEVNRTTVPLGETVSLTVTAEGDVSWSAEFELPEMDGVQVFGGSTNQSVSYINGQTMTTVSRSYFLQVDREQDFTIDRITVSSDGQSCQTDPILIKVAGAASSGQIPPANTGNRVVRPQEPEPSAEDFGGQAGDDIFITLETDRDEVWQGQQVILSFKYFRRIQPWNNPQFTPPRTEGFWRQDLGQERRFRSVVKGRTYNVTEIRYVLFPTRTGELTIEPAELSFPDQGLERFFSSRRRRGPRTLRTDPLTITVKALPPGKPENFSGLVASDVRLEAVVDRDSVPRGEPVDWKIQLVSDGFLQAFDKLEVPAVEGARTHDAGESFATEENNNRLLSAITVEKVIVPGQEGLLEIPRVELSWFDTDNGRYQTARSPRRRVMVNPSNLPYLPDEDSGFLRSEVARLAQDLAFIHNVPGRLGMGMWSPLRSGTWWVALLLPLVMLAGWRLYLVRLSAERRDPAARRRRRALKQARSTLDLVPAEAEPAEQLSLVARAVSGFVADSTNVPPASIGPAEAASFCEELGAADLGGRLREIMDLTETARFGGNAVSSDPESAADPQGLATETGRILGELTRKIQPARRPGRLRTGNSLSILLLMVLAAGPVHAAADPARLMAEGNQAYTQGDLDQTLELYLQAETLGAQDPHLFFNLGNTYARRGELGRAVAYYLQAQRLAPRDADIARNLAWVRSHITDLELAEQDLPLFIAQFVWVARNLTVREWGFLLVALVWLVSGIVAWGWYREGFSDGLRRSGLVSGALLLVVLGIFAWRWHGQEVRVQAVIIAPEISVHSGPAESFPVLFKLHDGLTVSLEGRQEGWARISLGGESLGWLPESGVLAVNPRQGRYPVTPADQSLDQGR